MSSDLPTWISGTALALSLASLGLSGFVAITNVRLTKTQKRMELLTRISEARIQYGELNRRYQSLSSQMMAVSPEMIDKLLKYKEYEKLTNGYYDFAAIADLSAAVSEELRHHVDSLLLHIASDNRRIDDWEKRIKAPEHKNRA